MKIQFSKIVLAAGISLALAFTFSCSDNKDDGSNEQSYKYCINGNNICLEGPFTSSTCTGQLSNSCPSSSNSSVVSSSSGGNFGGSSSSSSKDGSISSSSESQEIGNIEGNVFTDPRDGKKYKIETASDGEIWMSENLNYSRNNTLGYCYSVDINGSDPHRDSNTCDNGYGRVYEWVVAMDGNSSQGLCPNGWHVPDTTTWRKIVGADEYSSSRIKMSSNFYIYNGHYNLNPEWPPLGWADRGKNGFYWTSLNNNYWVGYWVWENNISFSGIRDDAMDLEYYSVRCVKD